MRRGTARKALGKLDLALEGAGQTYCANDFGLSDVCHLISFTSPSLCLRHWPDFDAVMRLEKENKQAAQEAASLRQALAAAKKSEAEKAKKDAEERSKRQAASEELEKRRRKAEDEAERERKAQELKQSRQIEKERTKREVNEASITQSEAKQSTALEKLTPVPPPLQAPSSGSDTKSSLSSSAILALSSGVAQRTPTSVTLAKPASVFEFEKAWSNIKDDTAAFWDYFLVRFRCSSATSGSRKTCVCTANGGHSPTFCPHQSINNSCWSLRPTPPSLVAA
jgi:hypothetical protein